MKLNLVVFDAKLGAINNALLGYFGRTLADANEKNGIFLEPYSEKKTHTIRTAQYHDALGRSLRASWKVV